MKTFLMTAALTAAFGCSAALAQSTTPQTTDPAVPQAQPPAPQTTPQTQQAPVGNPPAGAQQAAASGTPKIAPGSVIPVQLTKTVDAKKAKTGDEVVAKVTMDMKNQGGEVLVPKDTKVIGHVTEAQARSKDQKESQLAIAFDRAQIKGAETQMPMSIQAVIGQQNNQNAGGGGGAAEPPSSGGGSPMAGSARGGSSTPQAPAASAGADAGADGQSGAAPRPPINAQTTGVIGISDLNLAASQNATQGSVMTSGKNNVKLESGTMLLLKVSQ